MSASSVERSFRTADGSAPATDAGTSWHVEADTRASLSLAETLMGLDELRPGPVVRRALNASHVQRLAWAIDDVPPIVVNSTDGTIIDGGHRVEAARVAGRQHIAVVLVELAQDDAYVESVRLNAGHGLPLTAVERREAVRGLLELKGEWSDRRIAATCGVSRAVVKRARDCISTRSGGSNDHLNTRLGADGKHHPATPRDVRASAAAVMRDHPDITVRQLAEALNVSVGTAQKLRRDAAVPGAASSTPHGPDETERPRWNPPAAPMPRTTRTLGRWRARVCSLIAHTRWRRLLRRLRLCR